MKTDPSLYFPHISRVGSLREFLSPESFFGFLSLSPVGAASRSCLRCGPQPAGDAQKQLRSLQAYRLFLQRVDAALRQGERRIPPAAHSPSATLRGTTAQLSRLVMNICSWLMISSWIRGTASIPHSS